MWTVHQSFEYWPSLLSVMITLYSKYLEGSGDSGDKLHKSTTGNKDKQPGQSQSGTDVWDKKFTLTGWTYRQWHLHWLIYPPETPKVKASFRPGSRIAALILPYILTVGSNFWRNATSRHTTVASRWAVNQTDWSTVLLFKLFTLEH